MTPLQVKDCPPDLYQALKECAIRENRSISQQTVTILQEYLGFRKRYSDSENHIENQANAEETIAEGKRTGLGTCKHVDALERIAKLPPVVLSSDCPTTVDIVRQLRDMEAR